ncbi:UNVERIFIED_CONTAM: hypothetical protein K2H54_062760 [Gekko kuhli]
MADVAARQDDDEAQTDELIISRQELVEIHKDLHRSLREAVEEIIQPINTRLNDFMAELRDTSKKADTNATICTSLQEEVGKLKNSNTDFNARIMTLENRWRQSNLKLRGFEEGAEENSDLATFISSWLARVLQLEDGVAPAISKAYRLGPLARAANGRPRDILITFVYPRSRDRILKAARTKGKVRFRWSPSSDIIVYKNGTQFTVTDKTTGIELLKACDLPIMAEEKQHLET